MSNGRLSGKACLVTGVAGGIGRAIAERFVAEGARVVGMDLAAPAQAGTGGSAGADILPLLACDVGDADQVIKTVTEAVAHLGGLDVVVTAAALTGGTGGFLDVTDADWERYVRVNLTGTFLVCREAARAMARFGRGGSIITIGSVNSFAAEPGASPYVASKGGVAMLTKAMAVDLARHGIRANMIAPGPIEVPRNAELFQSPPLTQAFARYVPLGAAGRPSDVASVAVFLAEDGSRFVTGSSIAVDGGLLAQILAVDLS